MVPCPKCGRINPEDFMFCGYCATPFIVAPRSQQLPAQSPQPMQPQYQQPPVQQQHQQPYPQQYPPQQMRPPYQQVQTFAGLDYKPQAYPTSPQTMASQPLFPQPAISLAQPPASTPPQSNQQPQNPQLQPQYQKQTDRASPTPIQPQNQQPYPQTQTYPVVQQTALNQPSPQQAVSTVSAPLTIDPPPVVPVKKNCPSCGRFFPKGSSACPKCNPDQQAVQISSKNPDIVKPEPPTVPPQTIPQPVTMLVMPTIEVPCDVQSPYPQEKQPTEGIIPSDFACPHCGEKTLFYNRFSSFYCNKCKIYPWRCGSCKYSIPTGSDRCSKCSARIQVPWVIQPLYPQEKQPIDDIIPSDFACPHCGEKTAFINRFSSYYCNKCKTYPWRCKSCKCSIPTGTDRCPKCAARTK